MGLAVVLGIIRQHKGAIEVKSSPGMETRFRILFPVSETQTATDSPDDASNILSASDLTVLVADDEDSVLDSTSLWLDSRGVNVWRASGGQQTIELLKQNSQDIDLVLLDLTMPDMDSGEVVQRLREIDPKIPVILASGYSESDLAVKARDMGVAAFQSKPYNFNRLFATIMRVVSRK
jgi:DNA-binding NtrC family response regulator